jgi:alkylation response protein AidB-like acyl-CoA dehydrogenase
MKLVHTPEQGDFISSLRDLFADACPPALVRQMKEPDSDGFPPKLWDALVNVGAFGLSIDPDFGGQGASLYELGLLFGEAGRVLCPTVVYSTLIFGVAVQRIADADQAKRLLPAVARGEIKATTAMWDPADAAGIRPAFTAEPGQGGWTLHGEQMFVPNAQLADMVLVTARTAVAGEPSRVFGFFVEPGAPGWSAEPVRTMAGDKQARVVLEDYFVSDAQTIAGSAGGGLGAEDLLWVSSAAVTLQCMEMVGGATAVLERTVDYLKVREQFGRPLASFQAAQHLVANIRMAIDGARLTANQAVWWLSRGQLAPRAVAIAKMHCSEAYKWTTLNGHQLHGGMGFVTETDLHLWSERAKTTEIQGGTADVAASWLQRELDLTS